MEVDSRSEKPAPSSAGPLAFALRNVSQVRRGANVLSSVSVDIGRNTFTALIGPSGSGKTTLLRLLNRLDDPTLGSVSYLDRPIGSYPVRELRRRIAFVFQVPMMFPGTVTDNISRPARLSRQSPVPGPADIGRLLDAVELGASFAARDAAALSGGEQQRVALARALVTTPEVLLLDEPTAALDPEVAERLITMLARIRHEHRLTMVMVTHRLREATKVSDRLMLLEGGAIVECGNTADMMQTPQQARTREFMQSASEAIR
jgi:putative ABC transport system ATP-binding protein